MTSRKRPLTPDEVYLDCRKMCDWYDKNPGTKKSYAVPSQISRLRKNIDGEPVKPVFSTTAHALAEHCGMRQTAFYYLDGKTPPGQAPASSKSDGSAPLAQSGVANPRRNESRDENSAAASDLSANSAGAARFEQGSQNLAREIWKREREKNLEDKIMAELRSSNSVMSAMEFRIQSTDGAPAAGQDSEARARRIYERLMHESRFDQALDWLYAAGNGLSEYDRDARSVLANVIKHLVPWLFILGHPGQFQDLEKVELGRVMPLPIALHCFAEIISAGLERRALDVVELLDEKNARREYRGKRYISEFPFGGVDKDLDQSLRNRLINMLDIPSVYERKSPDEADKKINERLLFVLNEKTMQWRYHYIFSENSPEDSNFSRRISNRYKLIAFIKLDENLIDQHDSWWYMIRILLGFTP